VVRRIGISEAWATAEMRLLDRRRQVARECTDPSIGPSRLVDSDVQGRAVDQLLNPAVESPAFKQLESKSAAPERPEPRRSDRDDRKDRHLDAVDSPAPSAPVHRQAPVRAQWDCRLLFEPGNDIDGVPARDGRVRPVEWFLKCGRHDGRRHASHPERPCIERLKLLSVRASI